VRECTRESQIPFVLFVKSQFTRGQPILEEIREEFFAVRLVLEFLAGKKNHA